MISTYVECICSTERRDDLKKDDAISLSKSVAGRFSERVSV